MASIADILNAVPGQQPQSLAAGSETEAAQRLLAAKSGKALAGGGPKASNVQEQVANQGTQTALGTVASQAGTTATGMQQQSQAQQQAAANQLSAIRGQTTRSMQDVQADAQKQAAYQKVFQAKLANDQAMENTLMVAQKEQWQNANKFSESLQRDVFGQERAELMRQLGVQDALKQSDRDFGEMMANKSDSDILAIMQMEMRQAAAQQAASGVGSMASGGIQAADVYQTQRDREDRETDMTDAELADAMKQTDKEADDSIENWGSK